jgi:alkanesulfonate monooxygenase SsuD/methylene tetrahydromethanopterin reductase-like flavin-dependent oxidoreductase (luciferase family)
MKHAWSTGRHGWKSEFFDIPDNLVDPPCVQKQGPPILGGGTSKSGIERAATVCDGWFSLPMETLPVVKALADDYRSRCAAAGVTPYICLMRETWAAASQEVVEEQWFGPAREFHKYYWHAGTRGDAEDPVLQRVANDEHVDFREFVRDRAIAGTPEMCIEELTRWHDAIGFDELAVYFNGPRVEGVWEPAVEFFAKEVMPAFR